MGLFKSIFGRQNKSKLTAKSRLQVVLVQDRTGLSNDKMSAFKEELVEIIDKYFIIDKDAFDVSYERESDSTCLKINSPVVVRNKETSKKVRVVSGAKVKNKSKNKHKQHNHKNNQNKRAENN